MHGLARAAPPHPTPPSAPSLARSACGATMGMKGMTPPAASASLKRAGADLRLPPAAELRCPPSAARSATTLRGAGRALCQRGHPTADVWPPRAAGSEITPAVTRFLGGCRPSDGLYFCNLTTHHVLPTKLVCRALFFVPGRRLHHGVEPEQRGARRARGSRGNACMGGVSISKVSKCSASRCSVDVMLGRGGSVSWRGLSGGSRRKNGAGAERELKGWCGQKGRVLRWGVLRVRCCARSHAQHCATK